MSATAAFGRGIGRHAGIYGCGLLLTVLFGIANVVVMTRFLAPSEFGQLATLLFFAEFSAVVYNLGSMQGGLALAFGSGMDEGADVEAADRPGARDPVALGTTVLLTAGIGLLGIAAVALTGEAFADMLIGDRGGARLVVFASAIALFTAVWRVLAVVPHRERRPFTFVVLTNVRPALMTMGAVPLLVGGHGIEGALLGGLAGSAVAAGLGVALTAGSYDLRPRWLDVSRIFAAGAALIPAVFALWMLRNVDVYLLAQLASAHDAGIFRVASRAGALMWFPVSAILMGWAALLHDPLHRAAQQERGGALGIGVIVATYFVFATVWIELGLAIGADALVTIAPVEYASAAPLIPLVALGLLVHGWFLVVYRLGRFRHRRLTFNLAVCGELALFVAACGLLIPPLGATGAGLALATAPMVIATVAVVLSQRSSKPVPFQYARILVAIAAAGAVYGLERIFTQALGDAGVVLAVAIWLGYPLLLIALGVISRREWRQLIDALRGALPQSHRRHAAALAGSRRGG